jgi:hypothetical protein
MAKAARTATASEDDQRAEAADHVRAATGAEDAIAESASAVDVPATRKGEGRDRLRARPQQWARRLTCLLWHRSCTKSTWPKARTLASASSRGGAVTP